MVKGLFDFRLKFDNEKIIDQKCNNIKEIDNLFKDLKNKFK